MENQTTVTFEQATRMLWEANDIVLTEPSGQDSKLIHAKAFFPFEGNGEDEWLPTFGTRVFLESKGQYLMMFKAEHNPEVLIRGSDMFLIPVLDKPWSEVKDVDIDENGDSRIPAEEPVALRLAYTIQDLVEFAKAFSSSNDREPPSDPVQVDPKDREPWKDIQHKVDGMSTQDKNSFIIEVVGRLYMETDPDRWDMDKVLDGADFIQEIVQLVDKYGLTP